MSTPTASPVRDSYAYNRIFTDARKAQGFKNQAHLDAFYAHLDHVHSCRECRPGYVPLDDGMQPVIHECDEAVRLFHLSIVGR